MHRRWDDLLERMIFLLGEMDERTCTQTNPYEEEYFEALTILMKDGVRELPDGSVSHVYRAPGDQPEYADMAGKYRAREKELSDYRQTCKTEFFELFSRWFYDLWD